MNKSNENASQKNHMSGDKKTSYCTNYNAMQVHKVNKNMVLTQQN